MSLIWTLSAAPAEREILDHSGQCLVVTTDSWSATKGVLAVFERHAGAAWQPRGSVMPVRLGKAGLAWGRGVLGTNFLTGPIKVEGDEKAPAGAFRLSRVFGYAHQAPTTRMPYLPLTENIVAVDDPRSRYYNQLLDQTKINHPDWRSAEKMILADDRYKWGVLVDHNKPPKPGAGSSIFLHVWKNPETATTGCTALAEENLVEIIRWLDPSEQPLLIQLPAAEYKKLQTQWNLPNLK